MPLVRHRHGGRGDRRRQPGRVGDHLARASEGALTDPAGVIRPAVESALAAARAGLGEEPPVPPPPALRPFLTFARQTPGSLAAIARVVEEDADFRARVAAGADEASVGRAGWLWLTRPSGWEDEVAALEAEAAARAADADEARRERSATRKLAAAQAAARRAETEAAERLGELDAVRADLAGERAARAAAEARVSELEHRLDELAADRAAVVRNLKAAEARLVERSTEANALKARLRTLEAAGGHGPEAAAGGAPGPSGSTTPPADGLVPDAEGDARRGGGGRGARTGGGGPLAQGPAAASSPVRHAGGPGVGSGPGPAVPAPDRGGGPSPAQPGHAVPGAVAAELARAAAGAAELAHSLAGLARLLGADGAEATATVRSSPRRRDAAGAAPAGAVEAGTGSASADAHPSGAPASGHPPRERRAPVALPGGMFDDSVEAAEHLLRTPGAVLVVDGYNVSMEGWPDLAVAEQRRRLLVGISELALRTTTRVEVVFDGAEVDSPPVSASARPLVRVRFSAPGVEADDVVVDLVGSIPAVTPVIAVSSDRRVRDGARRRGANLLHARQLLALLGR